MYSKIEKHHKYCWIKREWTVHIPGAKNKEMFIRKTIYKNQAVELVEKNPGLLWEAIH